MVAPLVSLLRPAGWAAVENWQQCSLDGAGFSSCPASQRAVQQFTVLQQPPALPLPLPLPLPLLLLLLPLLLLSCIWAHT